MQVDGKRTAVIMGALIAAIALLAFFRANSAAPAMQVAFVGVTNFGNHAIALFAITNHLGVDVQGTAYLQTRSRFGWPAHSRESRQKRVGWIGPVHGPARSVTFLGITRPAITSEWRIVVSFAPRPQSRFQQARQRYGESLAKHGFARVGAWVQPRPKQEYAFGPRMTSDGVAQPEPVPSAVSPVIETPNW